MRAWIAGSMAVLGTLLVLAGGAIIVLKALQPAPPDAAPAEETPPKVPARLANAVRRMTAADRLIGWGVILLVLGAVAAGAIEFKLSAGAGTR